MMPTQVNADTVVQKELAKAIDKFAHTKHTDSVFDTYSNGERRSEQKVIEQSQQKNAFASIAKALKG